MCDLVLDFFQLAGEILGGQGVEAAQPLRLRVGGLPSGADLYLFLRKKPRQTQGIEMFARDRQLSARQRAGGSISESLIVVVLGHLKPPVWPQSVFRSVAADPDGGLGGLIEAGRFFRQSFRIDDEDTFRKVMFGARLKRER